MHIFLLILRCYTFMTFVMFCSVHLLCIFNFVFSYFYILCLCFRMSVFCIQNLVELPFSLCLPFWVKNPKFLSQIATCLSWVMKRNLSQCMLITSNLSSLNTFFFFHFFLSLTCLRIFYHSIGKYCYVVLIRNWY